MKDYIKLGESKCIDGKWWFKPDYSENGLIFKDGYVYKHKWDSPCYVSELAFKDCEQNDEGWYQCDDWDNHWMILEYAKRNTLWADDAFELNDWMYMATWIEGWDFYDIAYEYFYSFVQNGAKVWWEDPEHKTSGIYEVCNAPSIDEFDGDTIILLSNEYGSEVEALLTELGDYLHPLT